MSSRRSGAESRPGHSRLAFALALAAAAVAVTVVLFQLAAGGAQRAEGEQGSRPASSPGAATLRLSFAIWPAVGALVAWRGKRAALALLALGYLVHSAILLVSGGYLHLILGVPLLAMAALVSFLPRTLKGATAP